MTTADTATEGAGATALLTTPPERVPGAAFARAEALWADVDAADAQLHLIGDAAPVAPDARAAAHAEAVGFEGRAGAWLWASFDGGPPSDALLGVGAGDPLASFGAAAAAARGSGRVFGAPEGLDPAGAALEWALGGYATRALDAAVSGRGPARLAVSPDARSAALPLAQASYLARDLVNLPANRLGPAALEAVARALATHHGADCASIVGDALLDAGHPMIHAVGRASVDAPRLIELRWSSPHADAGSPEIALVGKGVCFDTGGLDVKPRQAMRNMKKDMGGAAAALAAAHILMSAAPAVRLRVLIPAVENAIGSNAFRPGDVLDSRKGLTVEIGDTDAEGRLILADALTAACEAAPDVVVDFATLTGAARVALGPELPALFTGDDALAAEIEAAGRAVRDPVWRLPLHDGYAAELRSSVADLGNVGAGGLGGAITAALFLKRFVEDPARWAHVDLFAWNPKSRPGRPEGGELQAGRAVAHALLARYG